jgi:hypothetical protein
MDRVARLLSADRAMLFVWDEETSSLRAHVHGVVDRHRGSVRVRSEEGG